MADKQHTSPEIPSSFRIEDAVREVSCMLTGAYAALEHQNDKHAALTLIHLARERAEEINELMRELEDVYRDQLSQLKKDQEAAS